MNLGEQEIINKIDQTYKELTDLMVAWNMIDPQHFTLAKIIEKHHVGRAHPTQYIQVCCNIEQLPKVLAKAPPQVEPEPPVSVPTKKEEPKPKPEPKPTQAQPEVEPESEIKAMAQYISRLLRQQKIPKDHWASWCKIRENYGTPEGKKQAISALNRNPSQVYEIIKTPAGARALTQYYKELTGAE